jgi:hypothetical protein
LEGKEKMAHSLYIERKLKYTSSAAMYGTYLDLE